MTRAAARSSEGPPTGPRPTPLAVASVTSPTQPTVADAGSGQAPPDAAPTAPGQPALVVSLELPYPTDARPRAAGALQAAAEDEELARWNAGGSSDPSAPSNQASYHPGTRVVVDTRQAKLRAGSPRRAAPRGLTLDRIQAQARSKGYWPFRLCFEAGQREKKGVGGETKVAFTIGLRGKVRAVRLLDSQLGNPASAACLVRETLKLEFTPRPATALAMVALIRVYPGDAELPALPTGDRATPPATAPVLAAGAFDPAAMRARVMEKQGALEACFAEARRTDVGLWGRLALGVILEMDGSVHRISEVESHFPSASATRCAQVLLSAVTFPSVNGKPYSFVVPIRLAPSSPQEKTGPDVGPSPLDAADAGAASDPAATGD